MCLDWCTFFGDRVGPIGTVFFTYVFILISNSIPTFEKNRAKSALVSDLPKTSNNNIKTFFHPRIEFYFSLKNKIIQFEIHFISLRLGGPCTYPSSFSEGLRCLSSLARSRLPHRSAILVTSMTARASPPSFVLVYLVGLVSAGARKVLAFDLSCHSFYAPCHSLHSLFSLYF
jgi:hypothetical protein